MIHWPSHNQSPVRRGEVLFSYGFPDMWDGVRRNDQKNKEGKPYLYPNSFILAIGHMRAYFHLPYLQTEEIIKAIGRGVPSHPCYEQMCKRINKLNTDGSDNKIDESEDTVISIDSTGIKVTNRGQRLRDKWLVKEIKGHIKIHAAVDTKTKEILALGVADEEYVMETSCVI